MNVRSCITAVTVEGITADVLTASLVTRVITV